MSLIPSSPANPERSLRHSAAFVLRFLALIVIAAGIVTPAPAQDNHLRDLINALGKGNYAELEKQVNAIAATGDSAAVPALEALAEGSLYVRKADGVRGTMMFRHDPRVYFSFEPAA